MSHLKIFIVIISLTVLNLNSACGQLKELKLDNDFEPINPSAEPPPFGISNSSGDYMYNLDSLTKQSGRFSMKSEKIRNEYEFSAGELRTSISISSPGKALDLRVFLKMEGVSGSVKISVATYGKALEIASHKIEGLEWVQWTGMSIEFHWT